MTTETEHDGAHRGRRISWEQFYKMFPNRRPANDNQKDERDAA